MNRPGHLPASYISVAQQAVVEQVIKKSRFIAAVFPVQSEDEVMAALSSLRAGHANASHICYAYKCGLESEVVRFSDAGEPGGTAGRPILEVIEREGLRNTMVAVIRYFGGVLLGAAGLVRAYSGTAALGVAAAGIARYEWHLTYRFSVDYTNWGRVERLLAERGLALLATEFTSEVSCSVRCPESEAARLLYQLRDLTGGRLKAAEVESGYHPVRPDA